MPALPPGSDFTASTRTEGQVKTAITDQRAFLAGLLGVSGTAATALATLGALAGQYAALTVATTLSLADRGKLLDATGTWTLTLPTAASAGAGFAFAIRNAGSGTITVDPSGVETIDENATILVAPGRSGLIMSTGASWLSLAFAGTIHAAFLAVGGTAAEPGIAFAADQDTGLVRLGDNHFGMVTAGVTRASVNATVFDINLPVTGTAVQSALDDATAGRLMLNGGHGLR